MSGGGSEAGVKGGQAVVGSGRTRFGRDADGGLGGGKGGGVGGDKRDRDVDKLSQWEDNISNINLGLDPNAPLAYAPVL